MIERHRLGVLGVDAGLIPITVAIPIAGCSVSVAITRCTITVPITITGITIAVAWITVTRRAGVRVCRDRVITTALVACCERNEEQAWEQPCRTTHEPKLPRLPTASPATLNDVRHRRRKCLT